LGFLLFSVLSFDDYIFLAECISISGETDLTYDGFYDIGHMKPGKPLMPLLHYCSQPVNTRRPILYVNTGTLSSVASDFCSFLVLLDKISYLPYLHLSAIARYTLTLVNALCLRHAVTPPIELNGSPKKLSQVIMCATPAPKPNLVQICARGACGQMGEI